MSGFLLPFMDTISRENNSMLPMAAVIIGGVALLLGGYAAVALNRTNKAIEAHDAKLARAEAAENTANAAAAAADKAGKDVQALMRSTQDAVNLISDEIAKQRAVVTKLEDASKKAVAAKEAKKAGGAAANAVAGPDEYIVKAGDGGGKIAKASGFSTKEIEAVNPGLDWTKLRPGQKLKLPAKK